MRMFNVCHNAAWRPAESDARKDKIKLK